jgi:H+-transporting ATPase
VPRLARLARSRAGSDIVKLSLGAVVADDVCLVEGSILFDQSMLTGESILLEAGPGL